MGKISQDLADFFEGGLSILVGSAAPDNRPECMRAAGTLVDRASDRITIFIPAAGADRTIENLRKSGRIAVTFSRPHDHRTCQVKGRVLNIGKSTREDEKVQERWLGGFVEQLAIVGVSRASARRWRLYPSHAVEFAVEELFDQTPGPGAGRKLGEA